MEDLQTAFNKAKIQLMSRDDSAFFTTVCFSLKHEWSEDIPTACTNGTRVTYNPNFFMGLHPEERVFLMLHEAMHCAFLHMDRLSTRDHSRWNIAADHVINLMLLERGFRMPAQGYADKQYKGMSTEEVYNLLPEETAKHPKPDIQIPDEPMEKVRQEMEDILVRASVQSRMQGDDPGSIPGEIQVFLNKLLDPKLPWHRILQKYMHSFTKGDYSFRKPNRRFFPRFHLPSLHSESLLDITVAVDISGSVSDEEFGVFVSEIYSILRMLKPEKLTLLQFDTVIHSVTKLNNVRDLSQVQFKGRGGTKIEPVMQWANENKPKLLLVFTDGEFYFRNATTQVNTIWVVHNNLRFTAPLGKVIYYSI